jgi:hypothetical protein
VARTQAVYYRDSHGAEPVDEFIQALPPKRAAKIEDFVEEHLNDWGSTALRHRAGEAADGRFKRRMNALRRTPPRAAGKDAPPRNRPVAHTYQDG